MGPECFQFRSELVAFDIPAGATITAATLWVSPLPAYERIDDPTRTYTLYQPSSISYLGLADGPALGSTGVLDVSRIASADWYHIPLNTTGLALLNGSQGAQVFLGGGVDTYDPGVMVSLFNYPPGTCSAGGTLCVGAPYLDVTVEAASETPEPGTWILILGGISAIVIVGLISQGRCPNGHHEIGIEFDYRCFDRASRTNSALDRAW